MTNPSTDGLRPKPCPGEGTTIVTLANGNTAGVDSSIADLVQVLNNNGYPTKASCSGHGFRPASIILSDGRELHIARNFEEGRLIDSLFPYEALGWQEETNK